MSDSGTAQGGAAMSASDKVREIAGSIRRAGGDAAAGDKVRDRLFLAKGDILRLLRSWHPTSDCEWRLMTDAMLMLDDTLLYDDWHVVAQQCRFVSERLDELAIEISNEVGAC
jgi:hypothetical protein